MVGMITGKEDMYKWIWLDHYNLPNDQKKNSFIYIYTKENKDKRSDALAEDKDALSEYAQQKKLDKYTLLRATRLAYKNSVVDKAYYIEILAKVVGKEAEGFKDADDKTLDETAVINEEKLLSGCISDFFQNSGYRFKKSANKEDSDDYRKVEVKYTKKQDGYKNDLDMWANFYNYESKKGNITSTVTNDSLHDSEYIEKCEKLFQTLNESTVNDIGKSQKDDYLVPVYFDSVSGAGIYIIGRHWLPPDCELEQRCTVCIAYFSSADDWECEDYQMRTTIDYRCYQNVKSAFDFFESMRGEFTPHYGDINNLAPHNTNQPFNLFFSDLGGTYNASSYIMAENEHIKKVKEESE